MRILTFILFLFFFAGNLYPQDNNTPVPFTLGDRDRLMRNEQNIKNVRAEINGLRTEMNVRFESVQNDINGLEQKMDVKFESQQKQINMIITLLFFLLGGMMSLIGFVIYDRRTAIKPVMKQQDSLEKALVEYAKEDKRLRDILKNAGIF